MKTSHLFLGTIFSPLIWYKKIWINKNKIQISNIKEYAIRSTNDDVRSCQGAALILAIGILALLTVLAVSFTTMMRYEERAGKGSMQFIQTREIASAALQYATSVLINDFENDKSTGSLHDSLDENWVTVFAGSDVDLDGDGSPESKWINVYDNGTLIGRYAVHIQDEAGKDNIQVSGYKYQNEGWSAYEINMAKLPGLDTSLAAAIIDYHDAVNHVPGQDPGQLAPDGDDNKNVLPLRDDGIDNDGDGATDASDLEGEGQDDPTEFDPEIPYGDDRSFSSIEELALADGNITSDKITVLRNYATLWSYDMNQYLSGPGGSWVNKVNINHLLSTTELYQLITAPDVYRMGANMIDYADRDIYPTITSNGSFGANNTYFGLEGLQFNEVMRQTKWFTKENHDANTSGSAWIANVGEDYGKETDVGLWHWNWDNGTYTVRIYARTDATGPGSTPFTYRLEPGESGVRSGTITGSPTTDTVTISGGKLDLELTAPKDPAAGQQLSYFDKIEIQAGKYIEIINISKRSITMNKTSSSWKLYFGGSLNVPQDGLPATETGGTNVALSTANNLSGSDVTLLGLDSSTAPPTYEYLIIADSLYALDDTYGNKDGAWAGSGSEPGHILVLPSVLTNLNSATNLSLTDAQNNVIAFAPAAHQFHIEGYDDASLTTYESFSRTSPVNQQDPWVTSSGTAQQTPGRNNYNVSQSNTGQNRYWSIKDRPYASIGELGDVFLGTNNNATYDLEAYPDYLDKITVSALRLEAENADSVVWGNSETASDHDGSKRYYPDAGDAGPWSWNWTFDINTAADITKPFRLRNGSNFDLIAYGQFGSNFQSPSGTIRWIKPNHGTSMESVTVGGGGVANRVHLDIFKNGATVPKLNFVVLTPEPYTWGRININTAPRDVLMTLPGITAAIADAIENYRPPSLSNNAFNNIQEIMSIAGIDEAEFKPISNLITVRSDVYRVIVQAQKAFDLNGDGIVDSTEISSSIQTDAVVDRNPKKHYIGTTDKYRIESLKYE